MAERIDLGDGVVARRTCYKPDRDLNPDAGPDIEWLGLVLDHVRPDNGAPCRAAINFDTPEARAMLDGRVLWQVLSYEPLTITPSVLCRNQVHSGVPDGGYGPECGWHGFITAGLWQSC